MVEWNNSKFVSKYKNLLRDIKNYFQKLMDRIIYCTPMSVDIVVPLKLLVLFKSCING